MMRWRGVLLAALLVLGAGKAWAAPAIDPAAFSFRQRIGAHLPLDVPWHRASGAGARLGDFAHGPPLVLALGYFHCPNLCGVVRSDLFAALQGAGLVPGRDYRLVALSIDPSETSADAAAAKAADLRAAGVPGAAANWHYLTGDARAVQAVADAVGFRDRLDAETRQFLHPAGAVATTPSGVVSGYLLGVGYTPTDMAAAVARARAGRLATLASPILLVCFHFDPQTGRYTLAIYKLLQVAAALTILVVGGTVLLGLWRGRRAA